MPLRHFLSVLTSLAAVASITVASRSVAAPAVAKTAAARAAASSRVPPAPAAPPRVFEAIQGFLRQGDVKLPTASAGAAGDASSAGLAGFLSGGKSGVPLLPGSGGVAVGNGGAGSGGSGAGSGNGAGAGAGAGSGGGAGDDGKVALDEKGAAKDPRGASNQKKGGGGNAAKESGLTQNPLWWPICFFIDNSVSQETGNSTVKGVVDMAAACGVTVVPFPVTATGMVNDHATINAQQQSACNITETGLAPLASTTALVPFPDTAGAMCGETKWEQKIAVAGCAQKSRGGSPPAPSIEVPKGHNGAVAAHEAMGHSQMDRPNLGEDGAYIDAGNGIGDYGGDPANAPAGGEANIKSGGWSGVGCAIMRANALPNTKQFAYDANRELYYVKQENPARQHEMGSGKKLFGDPNRPPPPGGSQIAKGDPPQDGKVGFDETLGKNGGFGSGEAVVSRPPATVNGGTGQGSAGINDSGGAVAPPKAGGRHDVATGKGPSLADLRQKNPPKEPPRDDTFAVVAQKPSGGGAPPTPFSGGGSSERLGFDETMTASGAISSVSSGGSRTGSGSLFGSGGGGASFGGGAGGAKLGFDETMTANGPTATAAGAASPKLFLGKGGGVPGTGFQSALAGDFFSKVSLGEGEREGSNSQRKRRNVNGNDAPDTEGRATASRGATADVEGGTVRSVGRSPASTN